jgi:hypothetical protein
MLCCCNCGKLEVLNELTSGRPEESPTLDEMDCTFT